MILPPAEMLLFTAIICWTAGVQVAEDLSDKTSPVAVRIILRIRKHKHLKTVIHAEIFYLVSRNLSGKAIDLYFNVLTWLIQKTENHLKLPWLYNFLLLVDCISKKISSTQLGLDKTIICEGFQIYLFSL